MILRLDTISVKVKKGIVIGKEKPYFVYLDW